MQAPVPPSLPAARLSARAGTDGNDEVGQETQYRQALYLSPHINYVRGKDVVPIGARLDSLCFVANKKDVVENYA